MIEKGSTKLVFKVKTDYWEDQFHDVMRLVDYFIRTVDNEGNPRSAGFIISPKNLDLREKITKLCKDAKFKVKSEKITSGEIEASEALDFQIAQVMDDAEPDGQEHIFVAVDYRTIGARREKMVCKILMAPHEGSLH